VTSLAVAVYPPTSPRPWATAARQSTWISRWSSALAGRHGRCSLPRIRASAYGLCGMCATSGGGGGRLVMHFGGMAWLAVVPSRPAS